MPPTTKKISVLVDLPTIRRIEDAQMTQTEAVLEALKFYFSEDRGKISEYKQQIISSAQKIAVLEARLAEGEAHRAMLERELGQVHEEYRAHLGQVQTLILQVEEKRRLLEDGKRRSFLSKFKFW